MLHSEPCCDGSLVKPTVIAATVGATVIAATVVSHSEAYSYSGSGGRKLSDLW